MITITDTSAGVAELRSPYDPDLVAMIKQEVPGYARRWDPDRKVWTIEKFYVEALVRSLRAVGFTVDYTPRQHRRPPPPREARAALGGWADELLGRVDRDRIDPVHRALCRVLHPDAGGDTQLMQELNAARDRRR